MLATCTFSWPPRNAATSSSLIATLLRPDATGSALRGVAGEQVGVRVDGHGGVVDRGRRLAETDGDQAHLARVLRDVAGREDPGHARPGRRVDHDVPLLDLEAPLLDRPEVRHEAERRDDRL